MGHILYFFQLVTAALILGTWLDSWLSSGPCFTLVLLCGAIPLFEWRHGAYFHPHRDDPFVISDRSAWVLITSSTVSLKPTQTSLHAVLGDRLQTIIGWLVAAQASVAIICLIWALLIQQRNSKAQQSDGQY